MIVQKIDPARFSIDTRKLLLISSGTTPSLCQANSLPTNCSLQQPPAVSPIDEDMDCQTTASKCLNTTAGIGESSAAMTPNSLAAEPEELELTIDYSIKLEDGKKVCEY